MTWDLPVTVDIGGRCEMLERRAGRRADGRRPTQLRPVRLEPGWFPDAEGSVLVSFGNTRVACSATVQESVPPFLKGKGQGWVTAEYAMLPRSSPQRIERERRGPGGRSQEIQRLVGRSLRAVVDMKRLGERSILIDCDVVRADGGTRTAAITGGWVALALACEGLVAQGILPRSPLKGSVAAVSVGIVGGRAVLDLPYEEDHRADVDFNVVMTGTGRFVEVQGTAEGAAFTRRELDRLVDLARRGIRELTAKQRRTLAAALRDGRRRRR
jgi:ribonuclease PH